MVLGYESVWGLQRLRGSRIPEKAVERHDLGCVNLSRFLFPIRRKPAMDDQRTFKVQVTQYISPNGRMRFTTTDLPIEYEQLYENMVSRKCKFEAEVLSTGEVSLTIFDMLRGEDADIRIVENGPAVQETMARMLSSQLWLTEKERV